MVAVHSTRWHRVSGLRPRLSSNVRPRRQLLRGETWYLLADPASGRSVRLNAAAYGIAARLDGQRTVQQVWDQTLQRATESATQDEVIDLLQGGQGVFGIAIGGVWKEIEGSLHELPSERAVEVNNVEDDLSARRRARLSS